jgi:PAS domain S-box-containing protein
MNVPQYVYQKLLENISDSIIINDLDGKILFWNKGAEEIFGYTKEEMIGANIKNLYTQEELEKIKEIKEKIIKGERISNIELIETRKKEKQVNILLSIVPLYDENGKVQWIAGIGKDITPLKELQNKLVEAKKLETVHEMVIALNHEMNQPLGIISTLIQLILNRIKKGEGIQLGDFEKILAQIKRISDILHKIREIKKIETINYIDGEKMIDIKKSIEE